MNKRGEWPDFDESTGDPLPLVAGEQTTARSFVLCLCVLAAAGIIMWLAIFGNWTK